MKTDFDQCWERKKDEWEKCGISQEHAKMIFNAGRQLVINKVLFKACELFTRPKTHPAQAVLESLNYAGIPDEELTKTLSLKFNKSAFDTIQADISRQFEEAFPDLAKKS